MFQDSQLRQAVLAEFEWEPSLTAGHVDVAACAGVVTLSGHVDTYAKKQAAQAAALRVRGVRHVVGEIEVRLPSGMRRSDEAMTAAAMERLSWNVSVPKDSIRVTVDQGHVTLTGEVDWWYQREAAEHDVQPLHGVVGVSNQVRIRPRLDTGRLCQDITQALHRSWFFDPGLVQVKAQGGRIVLTGTVYSAVERQVAAETARSAPGATHVDNAISVV